MNKNAAVRIMWGIVLLGSLLQHAHAVALASGSQEEGEGLYCAYFTSKVQANGMDRELSWADVVKNIGENSVIPADNQPRNVTKERCEKNREYCYTFWYIDHAKSRSAILLQEHFCTHPASRKEPAEVLGCWDHPDGDSCTASECSATTPPSSEMVRNNTRFCCCTGDLCNINVTDNVNLTAYLILKQEEEARKRNPPVSHYIDPFYKFRTIIIALSSVLAVACLIAATYAVIRCCILQPDVTHDMLIDPESSLYLVSGGDGKSGIDSSDLDIEDIKLDILITSGRYGEVFRAFLNDNVVAVKKLRPEHRQYYENERDIFKLPFMNHPSLVEFVGCRGAAPRAPGDDRFIGGLLMGVNESPLQYIIVTSYASYGNLVSYLKNNTVSWTVLCRMAQSAIAGLAHLHTEQSDGAGLVKPTVAHRDINSRNILVKEDLTCCICDFGFAMKIVTTQYIDSSGDVEERSSLADVGTLRYMAPEVLEGSVNLYDCRSSLTQVDIYAFGLVLWEIGTRCKDLYQGLPVPEYQLPFEKEIGAQPTFEDMQVLVSQNKARPQFPDTWKDSIPAMKSLKETIEDCWDQDAEARISSVCVEERCRELVMLWEQRQKYMMQTGHLDQHLYNDFGDADSDKGLSKCVVGRGENTSSSCASSAGSASTASTGKVCYEGSTGLSTGATDSRSVTADEHSVSTATMETMMTPLSYAPLGSASPSDPAHMDPHNPKIDCNAVYERTIAPHREHRGVNPTVARNTHRSSDEELCVEGNTLIDRRSAALGDVSEPVSTLTSNCPQRAVDSYLLDMLALGSADREDSGADLESSVSSGRYNPEPAVKNTAGLSHDSVSGSGSGFTAVPDTETLIRSGILHQGPPRLPTASPPASGRNLMSNGHVLAGMETQNPTRNHRIPYMQNSVSTAGVGEQEQIIVRPKKQNVPSNGGVNHLIVKHPKNSNKTSKEENQGLASKFKKLSQFSFPYLGLKPRDKLSVDDAGVCGRSSVGSGGSGCSSSTESPPPPLQSEVLLVNGSPITRPSSLPLHGVQSRVNKPTAKVMPRTLQGAATRPSETVPGEGCEEDAGRRVNLGFEASVSPRSANGVNAINT